MRKQTRPPEPDVLRENAATWNQEWVQKAASGNAANFSWHGAREKIVTALQQMNQAHCCFCDCFPLADRSNEPIEHFRPKSRFHDEAYTWANLYYICEACNTAKREKFEAELLRPDSQDYEFQEYFDFDHTNGEMRPNPTVDIANQARAASTIRIYDLDSAERRRNRCLELRKWNKSSDREIDEWGYRDYLEKA